MNSAAQQRQISGRAGQRNCFGGKNVKTQVAIALIVLASVAYAKDKERSYEKATIISMNSVECGYDQSSGKGIGGMLLGTDSEHMKSRQILCPEYVVRTERVTYRIRPKEEKHPALLPVGESAHFRMKKEIMVLRVPEGDDKDREYQVVSMSANSEATTRVAEASAAKMNAK